MTARLPMLSVSSVSIFLFSMLFSSPFFSVGQCFFLFVFVFFFSVCVFRPGVVRAAAAFSVSRLLAAGCRSTPHAHHRLDDGVLLCLPVCRFVFVCL